MVVLLPLPEVARKVLIEHDAEILCIFEGYAFAFATKSAGEMGVDDVLPLSKIQYCGTDFDSSSEFRKHIKNNAIPVIVRSSFIANSGHGDSYCQCLRTRATFENRNQLECYVTPNRIFEQRLT